MFICLYVKKVKKDFIFYFLLFTFYFLLFTFYFLLFTFYFR
jgi:hypothetical protein